MPKYIGYAFPFPKGPSGWPKLVTDEDAVWENVRCLFFTKKRTRVMRPTLGLLLEKVIFDNTGPVMNAKIHRMIVTELSTREPRATLVSLGIADDRNIVRIVTEIQVNKIQKMELTVSRQGAT